MSAHAAYATPTPTVSDSPSTSTASSSSGSVSSSPVAPSRATFGIGPADPGAGNPRGYFSYSMGVGGSYRDQAAVTNYGPQPLALTVYTADLGNASDGTVFVGLATDTTRDAGGWVKMARQGTSVLVPASTASGPGRVVLPFSISVPPNASPGDHGAALVAVLSTLGKNPKGENIRLDQRIAARMYIRVSGSLHPQVAIEGLRASYDGSANPIGKGKATASYTVHNTGNVRVAVSQLVSVTGLLGTKSRVIVPPQVPLLFPGASQHITVEIPGILPTFLQKARVSVTPMLFQDQKPTPVPTATRSVSFAAVPWSFLVALGALVLLVIVALVLRRRRRNRPVKGGRHGKRRPDMDGSAVTPDRVDGTLEDVSAVSFVRLRWPRLAIGAGAFVLAMALTPAGASAEPVPFSDPNAHGSLSFCDESGHRMTSGKIGDAPFAWTAVSSVAAPDGYGSPQGRAAIFAFQPIDGVDPGDWSGKQLTAAAAFTNTQHPMAAATILDPALRNFSDVYPLKWDGLLQIRMFFGAANRPQVTDAYPAAVLRVSGDTWTVVSGGDAPCNSGKAVSIESAALPPSAIAKAKANAAARASAAARAPAAGTRSAQSPGARPSTSRPGMSAAVGTPATAPVSSAGQNASPASWIFGAGIVLAVAAAGTFGLRSRRRRHA